jgi:tRNA (cytidine/uridine-2'-O-)-methyltransferase
MIDVVLHRPEIAPNTGNVIRLCANAGSRLHLVRPLGFALDDRRMRRAGLDYHELATMVVHDDWDACERTLAGRRVFALSTRGGVPYDRVAYRAGDAAVFGSETAGLGEDFLAAFAPAQRLCIPMRPGNRSLNLSNAVAVVVYEAWRQLGFAGAASGTPAHDPEVLARQAREP